MAKATSERAPPLTRSDTGRQPRKLAPEHLWGVVFVLPYIAIFLLFVVYPVGYGLWLGADWTKLQALFADPLYYRTAVNTLILLLVGVNLKMFIALLLSGYLLQPYKWMPFVFMLIVLPWAMPAIPTFISVRWMLNGQWGLINNFIWTFWEIEGPGWLTSPSLAMGSVVTFYLWKWVPFWTVIFVAGRTAIPKELYEAAAIDGARGLQMFRFVTFPMMASLYLICTVLSMIWTLGDYNTVRFITGGGPVLSTHVLATLGIRDAFEVGDPGLGMAAVISALPLLVPLVAFLVWKMNKEHVQL
ncbi:carbohydrate ABC transporter membrane protein 1, CUT1 family [Arboricoccus pini]|uniref:Carbohydrate ABC transporter membrane protein 1, CUT1 family n=1 Tax=Arboricoccus pini TaxID=1963835 RepID=A0A212R6E5_9PROT|nr:sugar ABC transporter permease [Arboricoccus pini]SNB67756.1 carbohydrate ABC transporter membrane protein 1, CUT1 family [Arboricoccus pini]